jgi:hypothetical protein
MLSNKGTYDIPSIVSSTTTRDEALIGHRGITSPEVDMLLVWLRLSVLGVQRC